MLVGLFAARIHQVLFAAPVIFVGGSVHVRCLVLVVVDGQRHVYSAIEQVAFVVFERRHQRMAFAVLLAVYGFLAYPCLYLLIHIRVSEAEHQAVCPFLIHQTQFTDYRLVVISIVETFHTFFVLCIQATGFEILHRGIYIIVVVRIVLESIDLVGKTIVEGLSEIHIRFMCIERSV